jgi:enterochelin esterase family protein
MKTLLERAQKEGTPVIEGDKAIFVWQGQQSPRLVGDFNDWNLEHAVIMGRAAPGLWTHTLTLPQDAYIEYTYLENGKYASDPLNPKTTPNGMGGVNHYFYMPQGGPSPLSVQQPGIPRGIVSAHSLPTQGLVVGEERGIYLYQPPTAKAAPLLVVLDGGEYMGRAGLTQIVDNLIGQKRIRPLALAMVKNEERSRLVEYSCSESTLRFIQRVVVPFACDKLNLLNLKSNPGAYGLLGASLGGLTALYTAMRAPTLFGYVLSQSGAFNTGGEDFVIFDLIRQSEVKPIKIWLDSGRFESFCATNRQMYTLLRNKGYKVTYCEHNGGHNYPAWRNDLGRGLETLFGTGKAGELGNCL